MLDAVTRNRRDLACYGAKTNTSCRAALHHALTLCCCTACFIVLPYKSAKNTWHLSAVSAIECAVFICPQTALL
eukprot:5286-Heterococcus_DN1.PRE.2